MAKNFSEVPKNLEKKEIKKPEEMGGDLSQMNSQQLAEVYRKQQFAKRMEEGKTDLRRRLATETVIGPGGSVGIRRIGDKQVAARFKDTREQIGQEETAEISEEKMQLWKNFLLHDEPLTFEEVQKFTQLKRPDKWPTDEKLRTHFSNETPDGFEIRKLEELKHWDRIEGFLEKNKLGAAGIRVVLIEDDEHWKNIYGSNLSKSSADPKTIILKKEIFEADEISEENISWLIHEIGHLAFYDFLDDKRHLYMERMKNKQKYTETAMESIAFQVQFDYLKGMGKTKEECLAFIRSYTDESFGLDDNLDNEQRELKHREFGQLQQYLNNVYNK